MEGINSLANTVQSNQYQYDMSGLLLHNKPPQKSVTKDNFLLSLLILEVGKKTRSISLDLSWTQWYLQLGDRIMKGLGALICPWINNLVIILLYSKEQSLSRFAIKLDIMFEDLKNEFMGKVLNKGYEWRENCHHFFKM